MPELPEVETIIRTLAPHLRDARIDSLRIFRDSALHPLSLPPAAIRGKLITGVRRRGKLAILELERGAPSPRVAENIIIHLRMTGRIFTQEASREQGIHTRGIFSLLNSEGQKFRMFFDDARTFGKILIANTQILEKWPFWRDLGPEPLSLPPSVFAERLKGSRPLKTALLDQKTIAGIGNIYADESLFQARILPQRMANSLSLTESGRLLAAIQDVLQRAIDKCGSSIRDYRDANGNAGAFQKSFRAYGRGSQPCLVCGTTMIKTKIGGRSTVFCPNCQH